jgi:nucleotide-binding universal stress UspA family protein
MKNPLRSEAEAFQFLLGAAVYFGLIAIAGVLNAWAGLAVFIVLSAAVVLWWMRARRLEPPRQETPTRRGDPDERRILVIANETVGGETLRETIRRRSEGARTEVLVVTPALNTPLKHWVSDDDQARGAAQERLGHSLARLNEAGIEARGEIGDGEPLQAIEDALRTFGADEIIISTHPEGRSNWLEKGVVSGARERFAVPITHVVVDLERESEEVR